MFYKKLHILVLALFLLAPNGYAQTKDSLAKNPFHKVNQDILRLFKQYPIVAIGEGQHNSALTFEWLSTLVNEKEFPDQVRNIVVEFGASAYQSVMDDFVNNKNVPDSLLKKCWRETTQILVWDNPIYEQFFREIRAVNAGLPANKRIRVLLCDPVFGSKENRDEHAYRIMEKEVIQKNQTALLIFGDLHLVKRDVFSNYASATEMKKEFLNVIQFLELHHPKKSFSVWGSLNTTDPLAKDIIEMEQIRSPVLVHTSDSKLGDLDFRLYYPYPTMDRTDHLGNEIDTAHHIQMAMKQIVDGILYRGSWEAQNALAPRPENLYADTVYLNELIRREQTVNIPPYRTRLYFYKISGSKEFTAFTNALERESPDIIHALYQPLEEMIPETSQLEVLVFTGYFYLRKKEIMKSIGIFNLATRKYPGESKPCDGLGDAYLANNELEKAIKCYEDALIRNPGNSTTRTKLEKLKKNN